LRRRATRRAQRGRVVEGIAGGREPRRVALVEQRFDFFGTGGGASRAALTSFFSTTFAVGSSTWLASATFSTSGFCSSTLAAFLLPAVICVNSDTLMMSTGRASLGGAGSGLAASDHTLHSKTAPWPPADMA
jgi:hypothetical protein